MLGYELQQAPFQTQIPVEFESPPSPSVRLEKRLAEGHARKVEESRKGDRAAMDAIQADAINEMSHLQKMKDELEAMKQTMLMASVPTMEHGKLGTEEMVAAGLSGVFGGAEGMNQALGSLYNRQDQTDEQKYKERVQQFQLDQKGQQNRFDSIQSEIDFSNQNLRMLKAKQIELLADKDASVRQEARDNLKHIQDMEKANLDAAANLDLEREKQKGKEKIQGSKERIDIYKATLKELSPEGRAKLMAEHWDDAGLLEAARQLNADEALKKTQGDLNVKRGAEADSRTKLNNVKAEYIPKEFQLNQSKAAATIRNINSLIDSRKADGNDEVMDDNERIAANQALQSIDRAMDDYRQVAQNARERLNKINDYIIADPKLKDQYAAEKAELEQTLKDAQDGFSQMQNESKEVRDYLKSKTGSPYKKDFSGAKAGGGTGKRPPNMTGSLPEGEIPPLRVNFEEDLKPRTGILERAWSALTGGKKGQPTRAQMQSRYDALVKKASTGATWTPAEKQEFIDLTKKLGDSGKKSDPPKDMKAKGWQ